MNPLKQTSVSLRRRLSGRFTMILGAQRSGTTLLFMMLTSHRAVDGLDENESFLKFPSTKHLLRAALQRQELCYKLPTRTADLAYIRDLLGRASILWMVRHPYAVISSMRNLAYWTEDERNWLEAVGAIELKRHAGLFEEIREIDTERLSEAQLGAYVWLYKMKAYTRFQEAGLGPFLVKFEDLLGNPKQVMEQVLDHLGLAWDERVLHHERYHAGQVYSGETKGGEKLDTSRRKPGLALTDDEKRQIDTICAAYMERYGYAPDGK
jgi:LPS sulfotransferase NodH